MRATRQGNHTLTCVLLTTALLMTLIASPVAVSADAVQKETFISSPDDGHLRQNGDDGWDALRDSNAPAEVYDDLRYVKVNTRTDIIYRGFLFFDTSSLPDDCELTGAVLHIYSKCTGDLDDCHLYILSGTADYPHKPLLPEDYALPDKSLPVCAHVDVGEWTDKLTYRTVELNNPETVVNTNGITKLCLLERRDFENALPPDPRNENELKLYSFEEGEGFQPYLEVFWGGSMPAEATNPAVDGAGGDSPATGGSNTVTIVIGVAVALAAGAGIASLIARRRSRSR